MRIYIVISIRDMTQLRIIKVFLDALSDSSNKLSDCVQAGIINAGTNDKYVTDSNLDGHYPVVTVGDSSQYID